MSFEVKHGEVLGIIGRNGAGKSTLLKILSRITKPTTGHADIYGRVGSLLEVGTGFHPELTGRENIFLNGAVLGMSRGDIQKRFDEIVSFAEVERFLDTPAKRYSSGMYMRLAFAVAAHLEPEVLIVDEVLAVGDAEFQKKCLGKMDEVAKSGRTVLFVSHNMAAVRNLCSSAVLLEAGLVAQIGDVNSVVATYTENNVVHALNANLHDVDRKGTARATFQSVSISRKDDPLKYPQLGDDILIDTYLHTTERVLNPVIAATIWDSSGARIIDANTSMKRQHVVLEANTIYNVTFSLDNVLLHPGTYQLELYLAIENQEVLDYIPNALLFEVHPNPTRTEGNVDYPGVYRCQFSVNVTQVIDD